jgi:hypothetical protein
MQKLMVDHDSMPLHRILIDVPPGALLGWIAYELYARLIAA